MSDEVWLPFPEYEIDYEVSSLGRVRRVDTPAHSQSSTKSELWP
jgi:hypothetical protein